MNRLSKSLYTLLLLSVIMLLLSSIVLADKKNHAAVEKTLAERVKIFMEERGRSDKTPTDEPAPLPANKVAPGNKIAKPRLQSSVTKTAMSITSKYGYVYTRVPRTHGKYTVSLKDGTPYTLESPDIWDKLPDSRLKYSGFNAPGQLVYRLPDGTERILYDCVSDEKPCVPLDPSVSPDGHSVLFSVYRGRLGNGWWDGTTLPNRVLRGPNESQLHRVDLTTGRVTALPYTQGVSDASPIWLDDKRIMFSSNREGTIRPWLNKIPSKAPSEPQLYIADVNGKNAINISPHELATAMHPYLLSNGRVAYSSHWMSHNLAYIGNNGSINWPTTLDNMWVVMDMDHAGGDMTALLGAHRHMFKDNTGRSKSMKALHFLGQRQNNDICVSNYYRGNNLGLGDIFCWVPEPKGVEGALPNFLPRKLYSVAAWSKSNDEASIKIDGIFQGKIGYPEGIDNNQLAITLGRGYCTQVSGSVKSFQAAVAKQPDKLGCDTGIYRTTQVPSRSISDLIKIVDRPEWHEFGARVVKPRQIFLPKLVKSANNKCILSSSDAGTAETQPHRPYSFNKNYKTSANHGGEIDGLSHAELYAIRFWEVVPNKGKRNFRNSIGNRLKFLGDAPLLPDKSFIAQLPCDTPYIMAGVDKKGRVIKRDQIAQSLRPGEKRLCGGCHLHSRQGVSYEKSLAFKTLPTRLTNSKPVPTFEKDIKPIFKRRCFICHVNDLPLNDYEKLVWDYFQKSVPAGKKLQLSKSKKPRRKYGLQRPYTSKYVNSMFARESLLYWKAANQRTDGRTDMTYENDIDFGLDHPTSITEKELEILAHWLDSGAEKGAR